MEYSLFYRAPLEETVFHWTFWNVLLRDVSCPRVLKSRVLCTVRVRVETVSSIGRDCIPLDCAHFGMYSYVNAHVTILFCLLIDCTILGELDCIPLDCVHF